MKKNRALWLGEAAWRWEFKEILHCSWAACLNAGRWQERANANLEHFLQTHLKCSPTKSCSSADVGMWTAGLGQHNEKGEPLNHAVFPGDPGCKYCSSLSYLTDTRSCCSGSCSKSSSNKSPPLLVAGRQKWLFSVEFAPWYLGNEEPLKRSCVLESSAIGNLQSIWLCLKNTCIGAKANFFTWQNRMQVLAISSGPKMSL